EGRAVERSAARPDGAALQRRPDAVPHAGRLPLRHAAGERPGGRRPAEDAPRPADRGAGGRGHPDRCLAVVQAVARRRMGWRTDVWSVLPAFLLYTLFVVYPLLSALADSLWRWQGTARAGFAGTANFASLFTTFPLNHQLGPAFWHTMVFFAGTMVVQNT